MRERYQSPHDPKLYQRISHVESEISGMKSDIDNLSKSFHVFATEIKSEFRGMLDYQSRNSRTNWGVLASWAGVVFSGLVIYTTLISQPIVEKAQNNAKQIDEIRREEIANARLTGRLEERVQTLKEIIKESGGK